MIVPHRAWGDMARLVADVAQGRVSLLACSEDDWILLASFLMMVCGLVACVALQCMAAPYGRFSGSGGALCGWGGVPGRVAWVLQELPSFGWAAWGLWWGREGGLGVSGRVLLGLFLLHYTNRTWVFPLRLRDPKPTPFPVFALALLFCCVNGWLQSRGVARTQFESGHEDSAQMLVGLAVFFAGMLINIEADAALRNLRADPARSKGYYIPYGGLFDYVSGANFLGEIIQWSGFAIASNLTPHAVAFALFTLCNIGPRAFHAHAFYRKKFEHYPVHRKALIPFFW